MSCRQPTASPSASQGAAGRPAPGRGVTKRQASRSRADGWSSMGSAWATRMRCNGSAAMRSIDRAAASLGLVFARTSGGVRDLFIATRQPRGPAPAPVVPRARADQEVRADERARRAMEEHRLVQEGTAIERDRVQLFHGAEERVVPQPHVQPELWVARRGRGGPTTFADGKRAAVARRAEVMETVRHDDPAKLAQRAQRRAEPLRGSGGLCKQQPAVFESQHRTSRAQTNPCKPHRPLAHPDRVRDDD